MTVANPREFDFAEAGLQNIPVTLLQTIIAAINSSGGGGAPSVTEDATDVYIDNPTVRVNKAGNKMYITRSLMDGSTAPGATHGSLVVQTGGVGVVNAGAGDDGGIQSFTTATVNTTSGAMQTLAVYAGNSATKSAGANALTNYAFLASASGGDVNYSFYGSAGDFYNAGTGQFGGLLTLATLTCASALQVDASGNVTLGSKVQNFTVTPSTAGTNANISVGGTYGSGCQITTKNRVNGGGNVAGIDIGLDTTVQPSIGGGVFIWRGANGGFGGAAEMGFAVPGTAGNYIVGSAVGDACIFNTTAGKKMLFSSDGSAFTIGAQLDGAGLFQAKTLMTGSTMGTGAKWTSGTGSPAGVVVGNPGDLYTNLSGGAGTTLYVKESGSGTTAGWVAK